HLERLGTTGRLAAGLAHDLRNVMVPFVFLESELERAGLPEPVLESVQVGMSGFRNLLETLETLRGFARGSRMEVKMETIEPGAGMGLYMARLIVEEHRGTISCFDRAGGGTRFEVKLATAAPRPLRPHLPA